ncbi:hypothetical protein G5714_014703 [Onychostoma macrolepis]|uniref:Serine palmitoyltransferase small subunit B n=2 Tax=Onychostoma macrolepis TaxID=369639 RepID=A0A7J6C925_9TELE|nr:hypothetical protein G5714_014703 [Onychostoma macrolepis]
MLDSRAFAESRTCQPNITASVRKSESHSNLFGVTPKKLLSKRAAIISGAHFSLNCFLEGNGLSNEAAFERDGAARSAAVSVLRMDMKNMREYVGWLYYQYLLITGIYVLEPWEQSIFNTVLFTMVAMVIYTSYVFVPIHVRLALEFFSELVRGQPESTVALMN